MYVSGTQYNFEQRLHHLGFGSGVLNSFATEALNYSTVTGNQRFKWDKEYKNRRRDWSLSLWDGGGFTPLASWEANNGVTGTVGNPVSSWLVGAYDLVQGTAENRPNHVASFTSGHAIDFDGSNDFLSVANPFVTTVGSLLLVFQPQAIGSKQVMVAVTDTGAANEWFEVGITVEGRIYIERNAAGTVSRVVGSSILEASASYQLLLSTDGTDYYLTLNGVEENPLVVESVGTYGWFGDVSSGDTFSVGACLPSGSPARPFNGLIGLVRVYTTDITH